MSKIKLQDAVKELVDNTDEVLDSAKKTQSFAEQLFRNFKKVENEFYKKEQERLALEKQLEEEALMKSHTKAWVMPDDEGDDSQDTNIDAAVEVKSETSPDILAEKALETSEKKASDSQIIQAKADEIMEKTEVKGTAKKIDDKIISESVAEKAMSSTKKSSDLIPAKASEETEKDLPTTLSEKSEDAKATKAKSIKKEMQAEDSSALEKPQAQVAEEKKSQPKPYYGRPAYPQQRQGQQPQGQYGRPAYPQQRQGQQPQGQYGRPAYPQQRQGQQPQGQYGRPAYPQQRQGQYGRPAYPQQRQGQQPQGQYGRPAYPQQRQGQQPQGQYGRPAYPQQRQGQQPQGQYGRPASSQQRQGQYGRPAPSHQRRDGGQLRIPTPDLTSIVEKERVSNYDPNKKSYVRQYDPERASRNKRQLAKERFARRFDDDRAPRRRRKAEKKVSVQQTMAPIKIENAVMTAETITVKDLTERIGKPAGEILKKLLLLGMVANINSELDYDTAALVASEFEVTLELKLDKTAEDFLIEKDYEDAEEDLESRPPVVTVMGHVDHGKTSLLDYIRSAKVTSGEAGGITQHIGAYTVKTQDKRITFLDTPGHEAFTAMRARGAQSTDIAILVVAADDGIMPQTIEAINHAKAADVPIIVAINKIDKDTANPEKIKQELTAHDLVPEQWGGETIVVPVSAHTGEGIDELLEMILLVADVHQFKANSNRLARGIVIEAQLDRARGPVATILVQNGTLRIGDSVVAGTASGRVRAMVNDIGERVEEAGPSMPVEVAGFGEVPSAGDEMIAVEDDQLSRQVAQERRNKVKASRSAVSKVTLDNLFSTIDAGKQVNLNLIVKADVQGSVEAVKQAFEKLSNDEVNIRILHSAVGAITQDDVNLASAFDAIIIGFNVRPDVGATSVANRENVDIRLYRVIYQAIEDIEKAMKGILEPEYEEVILGHAEVRNIFKISGTGTVAGCYVTDGKMQRNAQVRLLRDNVVIYEGKLSSLRRFKDDAREVSAGYECGISLERYNDIKEKDVIECFDLKEIEI